jgi:hypothetical protein
MELLLLPKLPVLFDVYAAEIVLLPWASEAPVHVAVLTFPEPASVTAPHPEMVAPLALKATVPVGAPELAVETVAVKLTEAVDPELAYVAGFALGLIEVVVAAAPPEL